MGAIWNGSHRETWILPSFRSTLTRLGQAQIVTSDVTPLVLADFEIGRDVGIVTVQGRSLSRAAATFCKVLRDVTRTYRTTANASRTR